MKVKTRFHADVSRRLLAFSKLGFLMGLTLFVSVESVDASVIVQGTRIVYNARLPHKDVQLTNSDDFPNVVQVWVDSGDPDSQPNADDNQFIVTPPMFRMEPNTGQSIRLRQVATDLPQDRESLFYLNVLQIPPLSNEHTEKNQVLVMIRNRLKLLYRPAMIQADPSTAGDSLSFRIEQRERTSFLIAENESPFFITLAGVKLASISGSYPIGSRVIVPFGSQVWPLVDAVLGEGEISVQYQWLDDYGGGRSRQTHVEK